MEQSTLKERPALTIRRHYPAPPEKVWRALTTPAALQRWMAPTDAFRIPVAEADVRVGGRYHLVMVSPEKGEHDVSGVYREVSPPRKLVYTWAWKTTPDDVSLVTIELRAKDGGTELTLTHTQFNDAATRDHHEEGWNGCLTRLERVVA